MKIRIILFLCAFVFFIFFLIRYLKNGGINIANRKNFPTTIQLSKNAITTMSIKDKFLDAGLQKLHIPVKSNFIIYNTGNHNLYIQNVLPDCHCTVADFPKKPIRPHDSALITLKYDASNAGPFQSSAVITSNTNTSPRLIFLRGFVKEDN